MANPFLVLGGIAISVATAAFGILQVPGWVAAAQDAAATNDIAQVSAAQAAMVSERGSYAGSVAELASSGSVKVTPSGGVRLYTASDPTGKHHLTVTRSASGAYFARTSVNATIGRGQTPVEAVTATGATVSGPTGAQVTAQGVPLPTLASGLTDPKYTNLYPDPGVNTRTMFSYWSGDVNTVEAGVVTSTWAKSGKAWRALWSEIEDPAKGDIGVGLGGTVEVGKRYTLSYWAVSNAPRNLAAPILYNANGTSTGHDRSPTVRLTPGVPVLRYITFTATYDQVGYEDVGLRSVQTLMDKLPGEYVELSDVMLYEGDFDPDRPFFSGSVAPAGYEVAWSGEPHRSASHAYQ